MSVLRARLLRVPIVSPSAVSIAAVVAGPALAASSSTSSASNVILQFPFNHQVFSAGPTEQPPTRVVSDPSPAKNRVPYFLSGYALPAANTPKGNVAATGTDNSKVVFQFHPVTGDDALSLAGGQAELNIPAPAGNGPAPLTIPYNHSDGSTETGTVALPDRFSSPPPLVVSFPDRWQTPTAGTTEQLVSAGIGLRALSAQVDTTKPLRSISIADTGSPISGTNNVEVSDIVALEGAVSGTAPPSAASCAATTSSSTTTITTSSTPGGDSSSVPKTDAGDSLIREGAASAAISESHF